jgi:hypothetical protein
MRRFRDGDGTEWDVWVGRESWGVMVALLVPSRGGAPRRAHLPANGPEEAERHLEALDEKGFLALLEESRQASP